MQNRKRIFRNYILPLLIIIPLIGIMVGCIYIPTWDHTLLVGTKEAQVHAILGPPDLAGVDNTADGYLVRTHQGFWVAPLCFAAAPAPGRTYAVRLIYDEHDRLISYESADDDISEPRAVGKLNQSGPKLKQLDTTPNRNWSPDLQFRL